MPDLRVLPDKETALSTFYEDEDRDIFEPFKYVSGGGPSDYDLVAVKKMPNGWEIKHGKPFLGTDGIPVRRAFLAKGVKAYYTNVAPFWKRNVTLKTAELRLCKRILEVELQLLKPKKVLLFGVDAAKFCPGFDYPFKKFNELLGRNIQLNEVTYRVVHAPGALVNSAALYRRFLESVDQLVHGEELAARYSFAKSANYFTIGNKMQAKSVLEQAPRRLAVDIETTGLDPYTDRILTIQLSWEEGQGYSFPFELLRPHEWYSFFLDKLPICQNASFDMKFLATHGVKVVVFEDTMIMHSLLDESPGVNSLDAMSYRYLGVDKWSELVDFENMAEVDPESVARYGARDADLTFRLANYFAPRVKKLEIFGVLRRVQNSIVRSELRGIKIDREKAFQFAIEIEQAKGILEEWLGNRFNLGNANSPKQVAELFYEKMGYPPIRRRGKITTDSAALEEISQAKEGEYADAARGILEYRHLTKAGSTYVKNILDYSARDGRFHPDIRLAATETGRITEKLLTLIPRADDLENPDLGKQYQIRLRELFLPDDGYLMIGVDYSGLEVAMAAYLTDDPQLLEDVANQLDTHSVVAIQAFGLDIPIEPVETLKKRVSENHEYQRTLAKIATFTWLYGGSEHAVVNQIPEIGEGAAARILGSLRNRYPGVATWQKKIIKEATDNGEVRTLWGRARRFYIGKGLSKQVDLEQERAAINSPNQSMSSDMNLLAFSICEQRGYQTLFPFHDAIYIQAPEDNSERQAQSVKEIMEGILTDKMPFRADAKIGRNWAEL